MSLQMHQREEEDYIEQVQKKKEAYEKNYAEFSAFSDQAQTLLNELEFLTNVLDLYVNKHMNISRSINIFSIHCFIL